MSIFNSLWSSQDSGGDPSDPTTAAKSASGLQAGIGAGIGLVGLGLEALGTEEKISAEKASTQASVNIAGLEQQENQQRKLAMQINYRRQATQQIRDVQQKQSMSLAAATNQGAQFSSGLAGGQAQASGEGAYNLLGLSQNLGVGNALFGLSDQISQQRIAQFQAQSKAASATGLSALGGDLLSAAKPLASLAMFAL